MNDFAAADGFGNTFVCAAAEVDNGRIPYWQTALRPSRVRGPLDPGWTMRHAHPPTEKHPDGFDCDPKLSLTSLGLCSDPDSANPVLSRNTLEATDSRDAYAGWNRPFGVETLQVSIGLNNAFAKQPPTRLSCSLDGYDPGTYGLPDRFRHRQAIYRFQCVVTDKGAFP